jgi:hypothetical protein
MPEASDYRSSDHPAADYPIRGRKPLRMKFSAGTGHFRRAFSAPAEEAFLTAIAVAHQQRARSLELWAALGLARFYNSTGRSADAHALLASALEGFSPTPVFPEIEEAQTLLAALPS